MAELVIYLVIFGTLFGSFAGAALLVWFERRLLGLWQDRLGPNRVGLFGAGLAINNPARIIWRGSGNC